MYFYIGIFNNRSKENSAKEKEKVIIKNTPILKIKLPLITFIFYLL